jgi:pimeloyl-ACP methyl ester carboxylesterase
VGASRSIWDRVTPALSTRRLVLAPDLPGFGRSDPIGPGFDLAEVARALAEALAARVDRPFDLVGNSLGGAVAIRLAHSRPQLVRRLVLVAPAGFTPLPRPLALAAGQLVGPGLALRRLGGVPLARIPAARQILLLGTIAEPRRLSADDAVAMLRSSSGSTRIGAAVEAVLQADLRPTLVELDSPLGLIWGRRDRVVPLSTLESLRELRPDAAVATIAAAAHVPQLEQPKQFVAALRRVLKRLERQPPDHISVRGPG